VFDQYSRAVYRFAYRVTQREDAAEDIAQEVFSGPGARAGTVRHLARTMKTYLFAMARNLVMKHYRDAHGEEQWGGEDDALSAVDPRASLEIGAAVASAVASLPPLHRRRSSCSNTKE
jgi:RNA polymerase sigma factor (sigma-70 family)